jgi:predicted ATPase
MVDQFTSNQTNINNRYTLRKRLGAGGMGAVFRAFDRLQQHEIALKQISFVEEGSQPSSADTMNTRLALANEFQVLASLHHPNIIRVLDYGFDLEKRPYFTMSLLEGAKPITDYAADKSLKEKVRLLIEMLQALAYMHRRNIIHRDLKPDNALVTADGEVKVLDFGLATAQGDEEEGEIAGTVAYMAPEVLQGMPVSRASDLYAVGVMAYEMFADKHPFNVKNPGLLVQQIFFEPPDMSILDIPDGLANVIARLMLKEPEFRYDDSYKVIEDICRAVNQPLPPETSAIRESYLQAAEFVGREAEIAQLQAALMNALKGAGSTWIVGGESGVGKSRLLDEIRTQAMVRGALVLHGQGIAEGGITYQMWRDPLRRLVLSTNLDVMDASILKQIIPDIGVLLEREIADAPELEGSAGQQRLLEVIGKLFHQQSQPMVLLMEDLQWAVESLDVMNYLSSITGEMQLLIIGNYRDDEAPDMPERLKEAQAIKLERLDEKGIEQLSAAMLGEVGSRPEVVDLLQRETEGNVFFLVEVVRALAEDAGGLQRIGLMTLPANIFAGGVQQVVQRRLDHIPFENRHLLRVAAISGRYLDLAVLKAIDPEVDLDNWLALCSNAAILEAADERWRFAHDKLREGLLKDLSNEQKHDLHILIAEKMQEVYREQIDEYAGIIADHYEEAKDLRYAQYWHARAGQHAKSVYAYLQAYQHYKRALELYDQIADPIQDDKGVPRFLQLSEFAYVLGSQGQYDQAMPYWKLLESEAEAANSLAYKVQARWNAGYVEYSRGDMDAAIENLDIAEPLARQQQLTTWLIRTLFLKGWSVLRTGKIQAAVAMGEEALELCKTVDTPEWEAQVTGLLAAIAHYTGDYDKAIRYFQQALKTQEEIGEQVAAASTINNVGYLYHVLGDYETALSYFDKAIKSVHEIGNRNTEYIFRGNRGGSLVRLGRYKEAIAELEHTLDFANIAHMTELSEIYRYYAEALLGLDRTIGALEAAHRALELGLSMKNPEYAGAAWRVLAQVAASVDDEVVEIELDGAMKIIEPDASFDESEALLKEANILSEHARTLKEWAIYEQSQRRSDSAQEKWQKARTIYEQMGAVKELERMPENLPV